MNNTILDKLAIKENNATDKRDASDDILLVGKEIIFRKKMITFTVISIYRNEVQIIRNNISKIDIYSVSKDYIVSLYCNYKLDISEKELIFVDKSAIPPEAKNLFDKELAIVNETVREFNGNFLRLKTKEGSHFIKKLSEKYHLSSKTIWKKIRLYLQSGFNADAIYDRRANKKKSARTYKVKAGRKNKYTETGKALTDKDKKIMEKYVKKYKSSQFSSIPQCYKDMIGDYYTRYIKNEDGTRSAELFAPNEMPSINQFRYYLNKMLSQKDKAMIKARRNDVSPGNASLNDADALFGVYGPTVVAEMDEQELDLSSVSGYDPTLCIGRLILHLIIDVQTKLIMAMSLSLDNNSVLGATTCLMNLVDDKVEFCEKYSQTITKDMWPSGYSVRALRVDRGAEYMSKEFERICNENGIILIPTPARTASRKGTVEQQFHIFDSMWKDIMVEYGTIQKLHDSNHHEKATLDYDAVMKICINNVLRHNMSEIPNFKRSKEMIKNRISTSPLSLWKYYGDKYHTLTPIGNNLAFLYSLMTPTKCYISRNGVRWEGLWYIYKDSEIDAIRWKSGSNPMNVRMDRRDVSKLYYIRNGQMYIMTLNPDKTYNMDFNNMPYEMYMKYREIQKELEAHAREQNIRIDTVNRILIRDILAANRRDTYANITNMYANREIEKNLIKSENTMFDRIENEAKKLEEPNTVETELKTVKNQKKKNMKDDEWPSWDTISDVMQDSERNFITEENENEED